jgi:DNA-binding MarR family transcriptional regulator
MGKKSPDSKRKSAAGRFAYDGLDRAIHEKARLGILTSLATNPQGLLFGELKELCSLTDGNLSRHLKVLQDAGLAEVWKGFHNNRPQTLCRITPLGRKRFLEYVEVLGQVVADAASASASKVPSAPPRGYGALWLPT